MSPLMLQYAGPVYGIGSTDIIFRNGLQHNVLASAIGSWDILQTLQIATESKSMAAAQTDPFNGS